MAMIVNDCTSICYQFAVEMEMEILFHFHNYKNVQRDNMHEILSLASSSVTHTCPTIFALSTLRITFFVIAFNCCPELFGNILIICCWPDRAKIKTDYGCDISKGISKIVLFWYSDCDYQNRFYTTTKKKWSANKCMAPNSNHTKHEWSMIENEV